MTVKKVNKIVATAMLLAVPAANGFESDNNIKGTNAAPIPLPYSQTLPATVLQLPALCSLQHPSPMPCSQASRRWHT